MITIIHPTTPHPVIVPHIISTPSVSHSTGTTQPNQSYSHPVDVKLANEICVIGIVVLIIVLAFIKIFED